MKSVLGGLVGKNIGPMKLLGSLVGKISSHLIHSTIAQSSGSSLKQYDHTLKDSVKELSKVLVSSKKRLRDVEEDLVITSEDESGNYHFNASMFSNKKIDINNYSTKWSVVGLAHRQPGYAWDSRRAAPYDVHDQLDPDTERQNGEIRSVCNVYQYPKWNDIKAVENVKHRLSEPCGLGSKASRGLGISLSVESIGTPISFFGGRFFSRPPQPRQALRFRFFEEIKLLFPSSLILGKMNRLPVKKLDIKVVPYRTAGERAVAFMVVLQDSNVLRPRSDRACRQTTVVPFLSELERSHLIH
ncbi:hypothetical protein Tco_0864346 [Tanacetum coccineum]